MAMQQPHFARTMDFGTLVAGLEQARAQQAVYCKTDPATGLQLWAYTASCVYDRKWDAFSLHARGLILDPAAKRVVATPFPKFFNFGENDDPLPDEPFEAFEKVDGSLIILFHHAGRWHATTRGAFGTEQALWAQDWMAGFDLAPLDRGHTYLAEAVYPANRIVVPYAEQGLVLLSAYDDAGMELASCDLQDIADRLGWRMAKRHAFASFAEMRATAAGLPESDEGYVVRFASGHRLKVKSPAYCHLHALINRVTPLGVWEVLQAGEAPETMRRQLPEELWADFDAILATLEAAIEARIAEVAAVAGTVESLSDKEVGLMRAEIPAPVFAKLFQYRRDPDLRSDRRSLERLLREVKPRGNVLPGYQPSPAIARMTGEAD